MHKEDFKTCFKEEGSQKRSRIISSNICLDNMSKS